MRTKPQQNELHYNIQLSLSFEIGPIIFIYTVSLANCWDSKHISILSHYGTGGNLHDLCQVCWSFWFVNVVWMVCCYELWEGLIFLELGSASSAKGGKEACTEAPCLCNLRIWPALMTAAMQIIYSIRKYKWFDHNQSLISAFVFVLSSVYCPVFRFVSCLGNGLIPHVILTSFDFSLYSMCVCSSLQPFNSHLFMSWLSHFSLSKSTNIYFLNSQNTTKTPKFT